MVMPERGAPSPGLTEEEIEEIKSSFEDEDDEGIYVGVEDDYQAPVYEYQPTDVYIPGTGVTIPAGGYTIPVNPRYTNEEEAWIYDFRGGDEASTSLRQFDLINAGYLDEDDISGWGIWGGAEADAMRDVMIVGNQTGQSWQQVLVRSQAARQATASRRGSGRGGRGGGRAAPTFRVTNPADLRQTFRDVARRRTGGVFIDESQIDSMIKAYQAEEESAQRKMMGGGTVVTPPSPEAFAIEEIDELDPHGAEATRFAGMANVLERFVTGGVS